MELTLEKRAAGKNNPIRREGKIPAVLYSKGEKGVELTVDSNAFQKLLNKIEPGTLSSKVFTLTVEGKKTQAIVKDVQYAVTTYDILHIDFAELHENVPVKLNIPVKFLNAVECAGVKLGGVLRQVIRYVKVSCLPKDIPDQFNLDVRDLAMGQSLKLNQIAIPNGVKPITKLNEVVVVVARK